MSEQSLAALDTHSDTAHPSAQSAASSPEKQQIQELHAQLQSALEEIGKQRALIQSHSQASLAGNGAEPSVAGRL